MRELLQRVTALLAAVTGAVVTAVNVLNNTPWPLSLARAAAAAGIMVAVCFVIGSILMRTALRRHYETWLSHSRSGRAGAGR